MSVLEIIASVLLVISWGFIIFGMIAIFKLKNLYTRILSAATIDTVGSLTIIVALLFVGITNYEYIVRFVLLIGFLLMTTPISSHVNIRSAFLTGIDVKQLKHAREIEEEEREAGELYG